MDNDTRTFDAMLGMVAHMPQVEYKKTSYLRGRIEKMCAQCNKPTHWIAVELGCFICSPACVDAMRKEIAGTREMHVRRYAGQIL